jgi:hypothetical protein
MLGRVSTASLQRADMPILLMRPASVEQLPTSRLPPDESEATREAPRPMAAGPLVTTALHSTATNSARQRWGSDQSRVAQPQRAPGRPALLASQTTGGGHGQEAGRCG